MNPSGSSCLSKIMNFLRVIGTR
ncbi:hypothetical protein RDI58_018069 [Solanum bulbocastanum]|uniref:Uncharacterized protein n=1 Tax=Solanum bulbocastanum TaxID=147425 RepID=A0AAN8Y9E4_SOLBU